MPIILKMLIFKKDNETAIVNLFTKLAVTGKLIRISDFSMTMVNKEGNAIPCSELSLGR